jgi:glycosyltransferase involved in cell wall biosynthesis
MRIVEINDIASVATEIGEGLRARGHDVILIQPRLVGAKLPPAMKPIVGPVRAAEWLSLIRTVRRGNFDLAHIHYAYLGMLGALGKFPYILHCHGSDLRSPTGVTRPLIYRALRHADHVFYSTPDLAPFVNSVRDDGEFLPNPIDTDEFRPMTGARDRRDVMICCALTDIKGAPELLEACRQLQVRRPEIRITAIAGGSCTEQFSQLPNVTLIYRQFRERLPEILNRHGVIVGSVELGIAGMAELEAMACGRPVINWFDFAGAYPEEPPFVRGVTGEEISAAVERLVDNPDERARLGDSGREWVTRHHRLDDAAARVETVSEEILARLRHGELAS